MPAVIARPKRSSRFLSLHHRAPIVAYPSRLITNRVGRLESKTSCATRLPLSQIRPAKHLPLQGDRASLAPASQPVSP